MSGAMGTYYLVLCCLMHENSYDQGSTDEAAEAQLTADQV